MITLQNKDFVAIPLKHRDRGMKIATALHEQQATILASIIHEETKAKKHASNTSLHMPLRNVMAERAKISATKIIAENEKVRGAMLQELAAMAFLALPFDKEYLEENGKAILERISTNLQEHFSSYDKLNAHIYGEACIEQKELFESIQAFFSENGAEAEYVPTTSLIYTQAIPQIVQEAISDMTVDYVNSQKNEALLEGTQIATPKLSRSQQSRQALLAEQAKNPLLKVFESKSKRLLTENTEMNSQTVLAESIVDLTMLAVLDY